MLNVVMLNVGVPLQLLIKSKNTEKNKGVPKYSSNINIIMYKIIIVYYICLIAKPITILDNLCFSNFNIVGNFSFDSLNLSHFLFHNKGSYKLAAATALKYRKGRFTEGKNVISIDWFSLLILFLAEPNIFSIIIILNQTLFSKLHDEILGQSYKTLYVRIYERM